MAKQAKCETCQARYTWDKEKPLRNLRCLQCQGELKQTMYYQKKYPTLILKSPPYRGDRFQPEPHYRAA